MHYLLVVRLLDIIYPSSPTESMMSASELWWLSGDQKENYQNFCVVYDSCAQWYTPTYVNSFYRELNKTAKLKGANIDTVPTLIGITHVYSPK